MGIYEDTGSLTYATTGPRDLAAAAWLLGQGGDLAAVRSFVVRPLDPERLDVLHRMTQRLEVHRVQGHRVGIVEVELGEYLEELAPLVSRCLEVFDLPLLFALFGEGDRVTLIARGHLEGVDLGAVLASFANGGGHATAASARLKDTTLLETRERLLEFLPGVLPPAARARDLMIVPFHALGAEIPVEEAKAGLNARRINAAPVERDGRVVGIVTRQLLDAALQHGLGARPVTTVMTPEASNGSHRRRRSRRCGTGCSRASPGSCWWEIRPRGAPSVSSPACSSSGTCTASSPPSRRRSTAGPSTFARSASTSPA